MPDGRSALNIDPSLCLPLRYLAWRIDVMA